MKKLTIDIFSTTENRCLRYTKKSDFADGVCVYAFESNGLGLVYVPFGIVFSKLMFKEYGRGQDKSTARTEQFVPDISRERAG
jgi:hypothetical protein